MQLYMMTLKSRDCAIKFQLMYAEMRHLASAPIVCLAAANSLPSSLLPQQPSFKKFSQENKISARLMSYT